MGMSSQDKKAWRKTFKPRTCRICRYPGGTMQQYGGKEFYHELCYTVSRIMISDLGGAGQREYQKRG